MSLQDQLATVRDHLRRLGRGISDRVQAPLEARVVTEGLAGLGLTPPTDLLALYGFGNGTQTTERDRIGDICFLPGYFWLTLEESIEAYTVLVEAGNWDPAWFPVWDSGGGDYYAVIARPQAPGFGSVVGYLRGEFEQEVEFESVATFIATLGGAYATGAFFIEDGRLKADYPRMRQIAADAQPSFKPYLVQADT